MPPGTLRQTIQIANDGDTIDFSSPFTITLRLGEIQTDKNLIIDGSRGPVTITTNGRAGR